MAVIGQQQCFRVFSDGDSDRVALYALRKVTTGDTVDLGISGLNDFLAPKQATVLGTTVAGIASPGISGSVLTMPTGLANDAGYMLVWGASA